MPRKHRRMSPGRAALDALKNKVMQQATDPLEENLDGILDHVYALVEYVEVLEIRVQALEGRYRRENWKAADLTPDIG